MTAQFTKSQGNSAVSIVVYNNGATTQKCQRVMYIGSDYVRIPGRDIAELEMWQEGEEAMLEHKRKARSISTRIAKQMDAVANANTKAKRKFISVVLSFAKSERYLENEPLKLDDIVRKWLNGMGYKDAQYYAVYHYDSGAPHVHVCVNLIDYFTHKAYDRYNDEYRSQKVCRQIEAEYGLSVGKGINKDERLEAKTALGKERKTIIQAARDIIAGGVNSEKQYIKRMKERGITVKVVHHANCRDGYSYRIGRGKPHPGYLLSPELTMRSITDQINRCLNISAGMDKEESLAQEQMEALIARK